MTGEVPMRTMLYNNSEWGYIATTMDNKVRLVTWGTDHDPDEIPKMVEMLLRAAAGCKSWKEKES